MAKVRKEDAKTVALREHGTLHSRPESVTDSLFRSDGFFDPRDLLQVKYELLRRVGVEGAPVAEATRAFGLSRPTFYEAKEAFERGGLTGLLPAKRGPRSAHKLSPEVMAFVDAQLRADASLRPSDLARKILGRFKVRVHPRSIERALGRSKKE